MFCTNYCPAHPISFKFVHINNTRMLGIEPIHSWFNALVHHLVHEMRNGTAWNLIRNTKCQENSKRNNFDGGFIVTGKGDSAVIIRQKSPIRSNLQDPKTRTRNPKAFLPVSGHYWFRNTSSGKESHTLQSWKSKIYC